MVLKPSAVGHSLAQRAFLHYGTAAHQFAVGVVGHCLCVVQPNLQLRIAASQRWIFGGGAEGHFVNQSVTLALQGGGLVAHGAFGGAVHLRLVELRRSLRYAVAVSLQNLAHLFDCRFGVFGGVVADGLGLWCDV